ncbi:hypothetical protein EP7_001625 [Isosphaeraceae bacterium EP7]
MRIAGLLLRVLGGLWAILALARASYYLIYAGITVTTPLEAYHLEAQFVHLAWRVMAGLPLYPANWHAPHVTNIYGPLYFWVVGGIGRLSGASIDDLFTIGRATSLGATIVGSLAIGIAAGLRYGRGAGVIGCLASLGVAPLYGFSPMVRPDLLAELLGILGFLAMGKGSGPRLWLAGLLLVLAALTKQTAGIFLVTSSLVLALEGQRRPALALGLGGLAAIGTVVGVLTLTAEPELARGLVGEVRTPVNLFMWKQLLWRMAAGGLDLFLIPLMALPLWWQGGGRDRRWAVLTVVLAATSLITSAKLGSDANYFLSLRLAEGMASATLFSWGLGAARKSGPAMGGALVAFVVAGLLTAQGTQLAIAQAAQAAVLQAFYGSPRGKAVLGVYHELYALAADPRRQILTDSGLVALHQKERAPFVDPFLFRIQVVDQRIRPEGIAYMLEHQVYELLILTADVGSPTYDDYTFGLPPLLARVARARYRLVEVQAGLFFFKPNSKADSR